MVNCPCEAFRREFEVGLAMSHFDECPTCRAWATQVASWRALGFRESLSPALSARLARIPEGEVVTEFASPVSASTPLPLPVHVRARLVRIPSAARARERVLKARYAVAASYLLAGLLSLAAGSVALPGPPARPSTQKMTNGLSEASTHGTQLLLRVGEWMYDGFERANQSAETLLGRLGSRTPPQDTTSEKEKTDGTSTEP